MNIVIVDLAVYKLSFCIMCDVLSGVEQFHYKKVMVSCNVM